jgi:hypothetical protein
VIRVTEPVTIRNQAFRFAKPYLGLEVIAEKGTVIGWDGEQEIRTPYDECVLVMPSRRLFPGQPRVSLPGAKAQGAGNTGSGRLAVFVKADCAPCAQRVQQLQAAGTAFDLYMVGSRQDDARIRQWATQAGIDPARVRARTITLNHDAGRWLSLGLPGDLPAVVREVNGQWQRQ